MRTHAEQGALRGSLPQGRGDIVTSTVIGLRHAVEQQPGLRFLGGFRRPDVGLAFKKGSPLAPASRAVANRLIEDGTYARALERRRRG